MVGKKLAIMATLLVASCSLARAEDVVRYRLGLGGTYTEPPANDDPFNLISPTPYIHGNETPGQRFNRDAQSQLRWDALVIVEGDNFGAANLVANLELRQETQVGPAVGEFVFSADSTRAINFSYAFSIREDFFGRAIDDLYFGGPNMSMSSYGALHPGRISGLGAGYTMWRGANYERPGVGRQTLPNGQDGLGFGPIFDGIIDLANLDDGLYYLVLEQDTGVNVLREDVDLSQRQNSFARPADQRPATAIWFELFSETPPPPGNDTPPPPDDDDGDSDDDNSDSDGDNDGDNGDDPGQNPGDSDNPDDNGGDNNDDLSPEPDDSSPDQDNSGSQPDDQDQPTPPVVTPAPTLCGAGVAQAMMVGMVLLTLVNRRRRHDRPHKPSP